ncbi:acyl-CoA desaturase [Luteolibacter pohnpeiensis]|uniref:Acyl-CoA desaturase n=1 Tax=Luteolibacter pohnpeiensis TaxID=454153 RepID=A0A934VUD3_9BACT|nr:acyl-CoA desaturase [Luteolibacter pohnpeiensis]MBK1882412.1 acyl-CoA desaturase [Luteolibacter pohnpeiensis]
MDTIKNGNRGTRFHRIYRVSVTTFRQWLDSDFRREDSPDPATLPERVDWQRTLPFIFLHLGCLAVIWVGFSWISFFAAVLLYLIRMFAITAFYHRYFSHRTFRTSRFMQLLFAALGNSSMQRGPLWWAATHRHHHKHADHEEDVHSPVISGFFWSHIGWLTSMKNFPTAYKSIPDLTKYRELVFLNRYDQTVPFIYGLIMLAMGWFLEYLFPDTGITIWQFFVWTFFISTTVLLHGTLFINSLAHVWGKRRYHTDDDSRNSLLLAIITLGEGWHNNHHRYPHSTRQGFKWWEFDPTYMGLMMLSWCGIIWDLKPVPKRIINERR